MTHPQPLPLPVAQLGYGACCLRPGRRSAAWLLALGLLVAVPAGALNPDKTLTQFSHSVWQTTEGLPQDTVRTLAQTPDGYLWLGTRAGLVRFDGLRMQVFDRNNTPELANHTIQALVPDGTGGLWIGTNGYGLVHWHGGRFTHLTQPELSETRIISLRLGLHGELLIGTYGRGLLRLQDGKVTAIDRDSEQLGQVVFTIEFDRDGNLWAGTYDGALMLSRDQPDGTFHLQPHIDGSVWTMLSTSDGSLWIGSDLGLYRLKDGQVRHFTRADGLAHDHITALLEDRDHSLWIGTYGGGIQRWADGVITHMPAASPHARDGIWCLLEDREGSLWAGTMGRGLHQFEDGPVTTYGLESGLSAEQVLAVLYTREGTLWVGTRYQSLLRFRDGRFESVEYPLMRDSVTWALAESRDGSLWAGTTFGLGRLKDGHATLYTTADGLPENFVFALMEDVDGTLWIGSNRGLTRRSPDGTFTTFSTDDGLSGNQVRSLLRSRDGSLWIGTSNGLNRLRKGQFTHFGTAEGLASNNVWALHEDAEGTLWLATNGGGLNRFRDGRFTAFTTRDGMLDDDLEWVREDPAGALWLGSSRGVFRVSRRDLEAYSAGLRTSVPVVAYGRRDGLQSSECYGGSHSAALTPEGKLWFATRGGVAMMDTQHVARPPAPEVILEGLLVDGDQRPLPSPPAEGAGHGIGEQHLEPHLELPAGSRNLTFRFAAMTLLAPEKVRCRYQLKGWDHDWVDAGSRREAFYTNLPPGNYRFTVMASDRNGIWSGAPSSVDIRLQPAFYQTVPFFALCGLSVLGVGFGLHRLRVRRLSRRERELSRRVAEHTTALREANEDLRTFTHIVSHDLRTPLVSLQGFTRELHEQVAEVQQLTHELLPALPEGARQRLQQTLDEDIPESLEFIGSSTLRMDRLVDAMLELSRAGAQELKPVLVDVAALVAEILRSQEFQLQQHQARVELGSVPPALADRIALEQIFGNLLSNAVTYLRPGHPGRIEVWGETHGDLITYHVRDNGRGISEADRERIFAPFQRGSASEMPGEGMGLAFVHALVRRHGGRVWCDSRLNHGTTFSFTVPQGNRID